MFENRITTHKKPSDLDKIMAQNEKLSAQIVQLAADITELYKETVRLNNTNQELGRWVRLFIEKQKEK